MPTDGVASGASPAANKEFIDINDLAPVSDDQQVSRQSITFNWNALAMENIC